MPKKIKDPSELVEAEVLHDFSPTPEEQVAIDYSWLEESQRRSAEFDAGRMKSIPAEEVFRRVRQRLKK
jgi:putative addiction module component